MPEHRLHSLHLEGQPRRDLLRAAREAIEAACGMQTLAAESQRPSPGRTPATDAPTRPIPQPTPGAPTRFVCFLQDGMNVYPLHVGVNSIGRLTDNDIVIRDECVSRRHCAVVIHHDLRYELYDLASKNGTLLNGKRIPGSSRLQSGDQIQLCGRRLTFHITELGSEPSSSHSH